MRIIHVSGVSGSGKTTFIRALIPLLRDRGATAVVKHLGHHQYAIEHGKDTTRFFDDGVTASVGVDTEKSVILIRDTSLYHLLSFLSSAGTRYLLVEGWKALPFPKVLIGTLPGATGVVLSNPSPEQLISSLGMFPDFYSPEGLTLELRDGCRPPAVITGTFPFIPPEGGRGERREFYLGFAHTLDEIAGHAAVLYEGVNARLHLHQGFLFGGEDAILAAVGADSPPAAVRAFSFLQERLLSVPGSDMYHEG